MSIIQHTLCVYTAYTYTLYVHIYSTYSIYSIYFTYGSNTSPSSAGAPRACQVVSHRAGMSVEHNTAYTMRIYCIYSTYSIYSTVYTYIQYILYIGVDSVPFFGGRPPRLAFRVCIDVIAEMDPLSSRCIHILHPTPHTPHSLSLTPTSPPPPLLRQAPPRA